MGERVIFHVFDGEEIGPAVYGHWSGYHALEVVESLKKRMHDRLSDVSYTTARLIQELVGDDPGNLGFGCWNAPQGVPSVVWGVINDREYSHGDAGVILIDCRDFKVFAHGGYAADDKKKTSKPPKTWQDAVDRVK